MVSCGNGKKNSEAKPTIDVVESYDDVNKGDWYEESVSWAVNEDILYAAKPKIYGVNNPVTKAQTILTMWKAAGAPGQVVSAKTVKTDDPNSDLSIAIEWAKEQGIVKISSDYSSTDIASRLDTIEFIWKENGAPSPKSTANFDDTKNLNAVAWAKEEGIAKGIGHNLFAPDMDCTKAHLVTFLFRAK